MSEVQRWIEDDHGMLRESENGPLILWNPDGKRLVEENASLRKELEATKKELAWHKSLLSIFDNRRGEQ